MISRKYEVYILHDVNCSSSYNHYGKVVIRDTNKRTRRPRDYSFDYGIMRKDIPLPYQGYPKYVVEEVKKQFIEAYLLDELTFYEYNQYSEKRYDNLRYHSNSGFEYALGIYESDEKRAQRLFKLYVDLYVKRPSESDYINDKDPRDTDLTEAMYQTFLSEAYAHDAKLDLITEKLKALGYKVKIALKLNEQTRTSYYQLDLVELEKQS